MKPPPPKTSPKSEDDRATRLAEALRANLHRRKAQARAVAPPNEGSQDPDQ